MIAFCRRLMKKSTFLNQSTHYSRPDRSHFPQPASLARSASRNSRRRIFPVVVIGSAPTNSTSRGTSCLAKCSRTKLRDPKLRCARPPGRSDGATHAGAGGSASAHVGRGANPPGKSGEGPGGGIGPVPLLFSLFVERA